MKRTLASLLFLVITGPALVAVSAQSTPSRTFAFTHVNLIDATGAPLKTEMTVVVSAGRIVRLGKTGRTRIPKAAEVIDASGKFLIPGLWDMHAHLGTDEFDRSGHLALFIANGVTGIRIMDGDPVHHQWRGQIEAGELIGPRLVIASPIIGQSPIPVAEARAAVRQAKEAGSDFVKVHDGLSREAYFAVIDEARRLGLSVAGHVPQALAAAEVSAAGQKSIEHFTGLDEAKTNPQKAIELAAALKRNRTWLCPTIIMRLSYASLDDAKLAEDPRLMYVKPSWARRWRRMTADAAKTPASEWQSRRDTVAKEKALVGLLRRQGVGILAGTDESSPFCAPGFSLHDELALLVEVGLTPLEALQSATLNPARFLNRLGTSGTIERGKVADLVLLEANPLSNIRNTQRINAVVINGRLLNRATLDRMLSEIATAARNSK